MPALLHLLLLIGAAHAAAQRVPASAEGISAAAVRTNISVAATAAVPYFPGRKKISVCISEYTPMVYCNDRVPEAYTGYEVELFRRAADILDWEPNMLEWKCINDWNELLDHLKTNDGVCDIAPSGVDISPQGLAAGIVYSRPTYHSGLAILVKNVQQVNGIWKFWDAFDWVVWVAMLFTCIAVAALVWAIDNLYYRFSMQRFSKDPLDRAEPTQAQREGNVVNLEYSFQRYFWEAITRAMMTRDYYSFTFAGNLVQTAWGFAMLIIFTLYIGNTSADLTALTLSTGNIDGVDSLAGKSVGTSTEYVQKLAARSIAAVGYTWETVADEDMMVDDKLKSGAIKALVLDAPFVKRRAAADCELSVAGEPFNIFDAAVAFPANFSNTKLLKDYNNALIALEDSSSYEELEQTYVTPPPSECVEMYSTAVSFKQVAGLWLLLALSVATAVVWLLIVKLFENRVAARKKHKHVPDSSSASGLVP